MDKPVLFFIAFLLSFISVFAQSAERGIGNTVSQNNGKSAPISIQSASYSCNYWIPRDGTWHIVPFTTALGPDYRNDDESSALIVLPFNFCLYGLNKTNVYINNNGNISFDSPYRTFTANGFPDATHPMVAPFWADVDTRAPLSGLVYYKVNPTNMIVQWEHVGYYGNHDDLLNTFQLIISDGFDPIIQPGKNVSFYYEDMQWTTGDASAGTNGFGGTPATVGVNRGNGVDYIQIGTFDHAGNTYDGPVGNADGIDFLDNDYFAIDACFSSTNVPPIANSPNSCDTVYVCAGDTIILSASYLSPEPTQLSTAFFNGHGIGGVTYLGVHSGNIASISIQIVTQASNPGFYPVSLYGVDNGIPADTTFVNTVIDVLPSAIGSFTIPPVACSGDTVNLVYTGTSIGSPTFSWDFGAANVLSGTGSGPYSLQWNSGVNDTVKLIIGDRNGCGDSLGSVILVTSLPVVSFATPPPECLKDNSFHFTAGGNLLPGVQYRWSFGNEAVPVFTDLQNPDSIHYSSIGFHTVELAATNNNCVAVPYIDSIEIYKSPVAVFASDINLGCTPLRVGFSNFSSGENNTYSWNFHESPLDGNINPVHVFKVPGLHTVTLIATTINGCVDELSYIDYITANPSPTAAFTPSPSEVPIYSPLVDFINNSMGGDEYLWDFGDGSTSDEFHPTHSYKDTGTYDIILIVTNSFGCIDTIIGTEHVKPEYTFFVPGAFTPNGDGKNDLFMPFASGIVTDNYHLEVFDRWGDVIYTSNDIHAGWNGRSTRGNALVSPGTYVYQLQFTDNQNELHKLMGKITVIH